MNSEDFEVGQVVTCKDPGCFLQPLRSYLKDRQGTVQRVYPARRPDDRYCGPVNQVSVLWAKRNGRGKEQNITMHARDLTLKP
jgi:hypothetical protein